MKNHKILGITLMLVFAVALNGCNGRGGNKTSPAPTPSQSLREPGGKKIRTVVAAAIPGIHGGKKII